MRCASGVAGLFAAGMWCLAEPMGAQLPTRDATGTPTSWCPAVTVDTAIGAAYGMLLVESSPAAVPDGLIARALGALGVALINDTLELGPATALNDIVISAVTSRRSSSDDAMAAWWPGHPALASEIGFSIEPSGLFANPRIIVRGDSAAAGVLVRAVGRARPLAAPLPASAVRVRLRLTINPESMEAAAPIVAVRQIRTSSPVGRMLSEGSPSPSYPAWARSRGASAVVLVWYVIDERGKVARRSIGATSPARPADASNYASFVKAVTDLVPSWLHDRELAPECAGQRQVVVRVEFNIARP